MKQDFQLGKKVKQASEGKLSLEGIQHLKRRGVHINKKKTSTKSQEDPSEKKSFWWHLWDLSSIRFIWSKLIPGMIDEKPEPSSFLIWFLGIYFATFTIASSRFENSKDSLELRISIITTQFGTAARKGSFKRLVKTQREKIPVEPKIFSPISIIRSFFDIDVNKEILKETRRIILSEKDNLKDLNLLGVDLRKMDLPGANLEEASLQDAKLQGANLKGANLKGASLVDAHLSALVEEGSKIATTLDEADLQGASLKKADLQDASLVDADLSALVKEDRKIATTLDEANLQGASLKGANLQGASLKGANLQDASLLRANLKNTNLRDVKNLNSKQIKSACNWEQAILPDNIENSTLDPELVPDCSKWNKQISHKKSTSLSILK